MYKIYIYTCICKSYVYIYIYTIHMYNYAHRTLAASQAWKQYIMHTLPLENMPRWLPFEIHLATDLDQPTNATLIKPRLAFKTRTHHMKFGMMMMMMMMLMMTTMMMMMMMMMLFFAMLNLVFKHFQALFHQCTTSHIFFATKRIKLGLSSCPSYLVHRIIRILVKEC